MAIDRARTLRGALAGAFAAGVWAAQQPLDKRVLQSDYDDVELLGKLATRGPAWYPVGLAWHMFNGALYGAAYANAAPRIPVAPWLRSPLCGLAENFAAWPLGRVSDRFHPARAELVPLAGNRRALAQATWRHLLFAVVLGELERRMNEPEEPGLPSYEEMASSNGHGRIEHAVAGPVS